MSQKFLNDERGLPARIDDRRQLACSNEFCGLEVRDRQFGPEARAHHFRLFICFFILMIFPRLMFAHVETGKAAGFISGFHHPISGWDHIAAMIAVGLWGAQLGTPAIWLLPVTFPMMMAIGGFIGLIGVPLPAVEIGIGISALVLGTMVAFEAKPPLFVSVLIVAIFAVFHGYAHGAELAPGTSALAYSLGFVVSTGCLHGLGILIGLIHKWQVGRRIVRLAGGVIAAAGVLFVWNSIR